MAAFQEPKAFRDKDEPPIYVGFGSMAGCNPDDFARIVLEALAKTGKTDG